MTEEEIKKYTAAMLANTKIEEEKRAAIRAAALAGRLGRPNADGTVNIK